MCKSNKGVFIMYPSHFSKVSICYLYCCLNLLLRAEPLSFLRDQPKFLLSVGVRNVTRHSRINTPTLEVLKVTEMRFTIFEFWISCGSWSWSEITTSYGQSNKCA